MWIARDKDGTLWLFTHKPHRCIEKGWNKESWDAPDFVPNKSDVINSMEINPNLFSEVTWETEPVEVDLISSKK